MNQNQHGLNVTKLHCYIDNIIFANPLESNEKQSSRLENYGAEGLKLRLVKIERFCAENRPKSVPEIWKHAKNVVPLYSQL